MTENLNTLVHGEIIAIFTDGGLIGANPSRIGGTWAWCAVTKEGEHIREVSAYLLTKNATHPGNPRVASETVTNNDTEFFAALRALESMKEGWSGMLVTDSKVTIGRLEQCRDNVLPMAFRMDWFGRCRDAFKRLGRVKLVHVAGHPTQKELLQRYRVNSDGTRTPVNPHQQWCDDECSRLAKGFDEHLEGFVQNGLMTAEQKQIQMNL